MYKTMKCTNQLVLIETLPAILPDLIIIQFALKFNTKNAANCYESRWIIWRTCWCQSYSLVGHSSFQTPIMPYIIQNRDVATLFFKSSGGILNKWVLRVLTFFFSMLRAFLSMTASTCFKTSDCPRLPIDPGADPTSGLTDCRGPFAFITEGI